MALQPQIPYSFADVKATLTGPGVGVSVGADAGSAEEGISWEPVEETDRMKIGADGAVAHSLNASRAFKVVVRLLQTSPINQVLHNAYNFQRGTATLWAQNILVVTNPTNGDVATFIGVAFTKAPPQTRAKEAANIEWEFNASQGDIHQGGGLS